MRHAILFRSGNRIFVSEGLAAKIRQALDQFDGKQATSTHWMTVQDTDFPNITIRICLSEIEAIVPVQLLKEQSNGNRPSTAQIEIT